MQDCSGKAISIKQQGCSLDLDCLIATLAKPPPIPETSPKPRQFAPRPSPNHPTRPHGPLVPFHFPEAQARLREEAALLPCDGASASDSLSSHRMGSWYSFHRGPFQIIFLRASWNPWSASKHVGVPKDDCLPRVFCVPGLLSSGYLQTRPGEAPSKRAYCSMLGFFWKQGETQA